MLFVLPLWMAVVGDGMIPDSTFGLFAQKWRYDFIVPDNGNFVQAIHAANNRADKGKRYRIFIRSSNYRTKGEGNMIKTVENGREISFPSPMTTLTAPNTSIVGEYWHNTQIENCPQHEGISITSTLFLKGADSTYIQDVELWSNFKDDPALFANRAVALNEKGCKGNVLKNVSLLSTQDTYYTNDGGTTYLEDCKIAGTVDFICGGGTVYFDHCDLRLVRRGNTDKRDIICAPATESGSAFGYVFNACYINGPDHQRGRYLLGRPWKNAPRCVFLNCQMNIAPAAEGWTDMHGTLPALFGEFESTDSLFRPIDLTSRKRIFKDAQGVERSVGYSPALTAEQAEGYTVEQVFGSWNPRLKSEQVPPPVLRIKGREIRWDDVDGAGCYAVCKDRIIVAFTTEPVYMIPAGTREGAMYAVRCANQMGGLGERSAEVAFSLR